MSRTRNKKIRRLVPSATPKKELAVPKPKPKPKPKQKAKPKEEPPKKEAKEESVKETKVSRLTPDAPRPSNVKNLTFSHKAWIKLHYLQSKTENEIAFMGLSSKDDPLYVEDLWMPKQENQGTFVEFADDADCELIERALEEGIAPWRVSRIWIHTHPTFGTSPSGHDEQTYDKLFRNFPWAVMVIVNSKGESTVRIQFNSREKDIPLRLDVPLSLKVDHGTLGVFDTTDWDKEFDENHDDFNALSAYGVLAPTKNWWDAETDYHYGGPLSQVAQSRYRAHPAFSLDVNDFTGTIRMKLPKLYFARPLTRGKFGSKEFSASPQGFYCGQRGYDAWVEVDPDNLEKSAEQAAARMLDMVAATIEGSDGKQAPTPLVWMDAEEMEEGQFGDSEIDLGPTVISETEQTPYRVEQYHIYKDNNRENILEAAKRFNAMLEGVTDPDRILARARWFCHAELGWPDKDTLTQSFLDIMTESLHELYIESLSEQELEEIEKDNERWKDFDKDAEDRIVIEEEAGPLSYTKNWWE